MSYNYRQVIKALNFAKEAHDGQVDKAGVPYIFHPVTLALQMDTCEEKIVALLHDVVEDTDYSIEDIEEQFGEDVSSNVALLSRKGGEDYFKYIERIKKSGSVAIKVKYYDLLHNSDLERIPNATEKDYKRRDKYIKAIEILTDNGMKNINEI